MRKKITNVLFVLLLISILCLALIPRNKNQAVKYIINGNMPRFKTIDGDLYDVGEYKEGHYYLVDDEGNISETTLQEWTKIRMSRHLLGFVYFVLVASGFVFFIVGFFYPLFKTLTTKGTSSRL